MITESMKLTSRRDATTWAANMGDLSDEQMERVTRWIWENAPSIGCTYEEHPINGMDLEQFWRIVEGEAE